ncbi:type II toxin-antitoxin system RelE/ParE family toxin [Cohnella sp. LGH]|uniref:type II toxin-antitoxin system RelE/ParE family toxin n=1 Tax=Cohnella sp. LGH TaxID=1619153 RepID=UPI001ADD1202|nr:type II toxin-antitoxin system RelE/ParE family toxin [Cohnella sp. LGH]QTH41785.1 type II toxin-antitoxin system RelE/ParE family toxin [Cohnella sp. LGH]
MRSKSRIKYTPAAVDDMDEIFSYISQDNVAAAEELLERINRQISSLADFSNRGSMLSDEEYAIIQRGYRFIVVSPYLVFYRLVENTVIIYRILHVETICENYSDRQYREYCQVLADGVSYRQLNRKETGA